MFYYTPISRLSVAPFDILNSEWMLITAGKGESINTMTASWGGLETMWGKPVAFVVVRPQRYTKEFIDACETFSLSFFEDSFKTQLRYLGAVSGKDEHKIKESGLYPMILQGTPAFEECIHDYDLQKIVCASIEKEGISRFVNTLKMEPK